MHGRALRACGGMPGAERALRALGELELVSRAQEEEEGGAGGERKRARQAGMGESVERGGRVLLELPPGLWPLVKGRERARAV